jgi:hypothetical protein
MHKPLRARCLRAWHEQSRAQVSRAMASSLHPPSHTCCAMPGLHGTWHAATSLAHLDHQRTSAPQHVLLCGTAHLAASTCDTVHVLKPAPSLLLPCCPLPLASCSLPSTLLLLLPLLPSSSCCCCCRCPGRGTSHRWACLLSASGVKCCPSQSHCLARACTSSLLGPAGSGAAASAAALPSKCAALLPAAGPTESAGPGSGAAARRSPASTADDSAASGRLPACCAAAAEVATC